MVDDIVETNVDKRFRLSGEQFAQERIRTIKDTVAELQVQHPEVLSLTMYGSMVKGTAKPESDIDGYLFVGVEEAKRAGKQFNLVEIRKEQYGVSVNVLFDDKTHIEYEQMIRTPLVEKLGLTDKQVEHMKVRPISNEIIDARVNEMLAWSREMDKYETRQREIQPYLDDKSGLNILDAPKGILMPDPVSPGSNLSAMFHLDVGRGIGRYRQYLLERL